MGGFKAISYTEENVGKHIKSSKKKYTWLANLDENELKVELFISKISKKVKVLINNDLVYHGKISKGNLLQYSQEYFGKQVNLIQQGKVFDLRVDSISFDYIYLQNKNKEEFKYEFADDHKEELREEEVKVVKSTNPFDDLFDEPKVVEKEPPAENKPLKLKPFSIKPPGPPQQSHNKNLGIFQPPDIKPAKSNLDGNLFENPSKPGESNAGTVSFPQAENPFLTGNFLASNVKPQASVNSQYYTGYSHYK